MSEIETRERVDLLPCPFCGSDVSIKERGDLLVFLCPEASPCFGSGLGNFARAAQRAEAIGAWNARTPAQTQTFKDGFAAGLEAAKVTPEMVAEAEEAVGPDDGWTLGYRSSFAAHLNAAIRALKEPS